MGKQAALGAIRRIQGPCSPFRLATSTTNVVVARPMPITTFIGTDTRPADGWPSASS